ncbi:hypothetical protein [Methylobacterium indicum]|nr:hypothetical protein [Methylobacterium indicum]
MTKSMVAGAVFLGATVLAGAAQAQSTVTATVRNNTSTTVTFSSPSGCQGSPTNFGNIGPNGSVTGSARSPYSTSNGCSIRYTRSDNSRDCSWVLSRTRNSTTGSWNYPTINTNSSSSGVTCSGRVASVSSSGDWQANLTISP